MLSDEEDNVAKRAKVEKAAKVETVQTTYERDPVPFDRTGQCPCCLRQHCVVKTGRLVRHGWKEQGRQVGQHGRGFQWGACIGHGLRPLEQTDADAVTVIKQLDAALAKARADLAKNRKTGSDSYTHVERETYRREQDTAIYLAAVQKKGASATASYEPGRSYGGRDGTVVITCVVARGAAEIQVTGKELDGIPSLGYSSVYVRVPSWDALREREATGLERVIKSLEQQRVDILAAVKHHRENPSQGGEDTRRKGPLLHWAVERKSSAGQVIRTVGACQVFGRRYLSTTKEREKVTCSRCIKNLPPLP